MSAEIHTASHERLNRVLCAQPSVNFRTVMTDADHHDFNDSERSSSASPGPARSTPYTSRTSFSTRSVSPTLSVWSMTSSLRAEAYIQEFGRDLNNISEIYHLPADAEELERLGEINFGGSESDITLFRPPARDFQRGHWKIYSPAAASHG